MDCRVNFSKLKTNCSSCNLGDLCMPSNLDAADMYRIEEVFSPLRKVLKGDNLFRNGEKFNSLYAIRNGFFKTSFISPDGREQVTGFQMSGEMMGLDGIANEHHACDAIALEDSNVCVMNFEKLEELSREVIGFQRHVHKIFSNELLRDHRVMLLLGGMCAEERLATFLLNLLQRLHTRGFSQSELILRMTREDMGSYLGMKIETVSRTFAKFVNSGIVVVNRRHVQIMDLDALKQLVAVHS